MNEVNPFDNNYDDLGDENKNNPYDEISKSNIEMSSMNPFDEINPSSIKVEEAINSYYRCECNSIPKLKLFYDNNGVFVSHKCEKGHNGKIELSKFFEEFSKFDISDIACHGCGDTQENNKSFTYCSDCESFFCSQCLKDHNQDHKKLCPIGKFDFICHEHNKPFIKYCSICSKNLCEECKDQHENVKEINNQIDLSKYKEKIKKAKEYCKIVVNNVIKYLNEIDNKKKILLENFEHFKLINKLEIDLCNTIIKCAEQIQNKKELKNNIIIKNVQDILNFNKLDSSKIQMNPENNSIENLLSNSNIFLTNTNNFVLRKSIENSSIDHLKTIFENSEEKYFMLNGTHLSDGKIACSFTNGTINVYNKNLQKELSIKIQEGDYCLALYQLPNDELLVGTNNGFLISYLIKGNQYSEHGRIKVSENRILKIINHPNKKKLIIGVDGGEIKILNIEQPYYEIDKESFDSQHFIVNILLVNKTLITFSREDQIIKFWDYDEQNNKFKRIDSDLRDIPVADWVEGVVNVDNERIIVVGANQATLINVNTHQYNSICNLSEEYISIFYIDNKTFLIGGTNKLSQLVISNEQLVLLKNVGATSVEGNLVTKILDCGNDGIVIGTSRGIVKIYDFE